MPRIKDPSPAAVDDLASLVDLDLDENEAASIAAAVAASNDRFDRYQLFDAAATQSPDSDCEVTSADRRDPHNAFISQFTLKQPEAAGQLANYRLAVKDNIAVAGVPFTCGSVALSNCVPSVSSPVVQNLIDAGVTVVGKTNMDEFAYGVTGETSAFGATTNPVNTARSPGGSSSGSAAAVASDAADVALGTDTGGSVRMPAAWCGLVGFKPGRGTLPLRGVITIAPSQDQVGIIARSSDTVQKVFQTVVGETDMPPIRVEGVRIGILEDYFTDEVSEEVAAAVVTELERLESLGATLVPLSSPSLTRIRAAANVISTSEFAVEFLKRFTPIGETGPVDVQLATDIASAVSERSRELGDTVKAKVIEGLCHLRATDASPYLLAKAEQRYLEAKHTTMLADVDVLACPTAPTTAVELGTDPPYDPTLFTRAASICGLPAISLPCQSTIERPVGVQFVAGQKDDAELLAIARAIERTHS